jgi:hypothetical protein
MDSSGKQWSCQHWPFVATNYCSATVRWQGKKQVLYSPFLLFCYWNNTPSCTGKQRDKKKIPKLLPTVITSQSPLHRSLLGSTWFHTALLHASWPHHCTTAVLICLPSSIPRFCSWRGARPMVVTTLDKDQDSQCTLHLLSALHTLTQSSQDS